MYMKNRLVHHLISTKLHCAPSRCTSVQKNVGAPSFSSGLEKIGHDGAHRRSVVHKAGQWCITYSSVPLKWCKTQVQHTLSDRQIDQLTNWQTLTNVLSPSSAVDHYKKSMFNMMMKLSRISYNTRVNTDSLGFFPPPNWMPFLDLNNRSLCIEHYYWALFSIDHFFWQLN